MYEANRYRGKFARLCTGAFLTPLAVHSSNLGIPALRLAVSATGRLGGGLASNETLLLVLRFFHGMGNAAIWASSMALVYDILPADKRMGYMGLYLGAGYLGMTSGPVIGGLLIDRLGWRAAFYVPAPLMYVTALAILLILRNQGA